MRIHLSDTEGGAATISTTWFNYELFTITCMPTLSRLCPHRALLLPSGYYVSYYYSPEDPDGDLFCLRDSPAILKSRSISNIEEYLMCLWLSTRPMSKIQTRYPDVLVRIVDEFNELYDRQLLTEF